MKALNRFSILFVAAALVVGSSSVSSVAKADVSGDLESLGSNSEVNRRASRLENRSRVAIVQNRAVKRDWRFELGANYGPVASGDSYLQTQSLGGQLDLHVTPKFSLGVRYNKSFNALTPTGKQQFEAARAAKQSGATNYNVPDLDFPEESIMGVANWYMFYGKINFFDINVIQFDIYSLAGGGSIKLDSGTTGTWTAGGGIGFWLSKHVTSRMEVRYQNYTDQLYTGSRSLDLIVASFGIGVLL